MIEIIVRDGNGLDLRIEMERHAERALVIQLDENGALHFRYTIVPLVTVQPLPMGGRGLRVQ